MHQYEVILTIVVNKCNDSRYLGYAIRSRVKILPPGEYYTRTEPISHGMCKVFSTELSFKDVRGNSWVRKSDGKLISINENPPEYYKISRPVMWTNCEKVSK